MTAEMTQTQERKLWKQVKDGKGEAIQWNNVLDLFCQQQLNRQNAALKRIPITALTTLSDITNSMLETRQPEIEEINKRKQNIETVREQMKAFNLTLADIECNCIPKNNNHPTNKEASEKESKILEYLQLTADSSGRVRVSFKAAKEIIGDECTNQAWLSNGIAKLKAKGAISTTPARCVYRIN